MQLTELTIVRCSNYIGRVRVVGEAHGACMIDVSCLSVSQEFCGDEFRMGTIADPEVPI